MFPAILRDLDATRKLFEVVLDSPNGRRSLSRLARTCRALCEPALNVLWRELDSILPLISLFPNQLMKRARRPGLGLAKAPTSEDWVKVLAYGERVRRITYIESANVVSTAVFTIIGESRPQTYILPRLQQLVWKVETAAGLERCLLFLNPALQSLVLEVGTRFPQLSSFLVDVCSRTQLSSFSFSSPTSLPDNFTDLLRSQGSLEKLALVAPGALSSQVGQWSASLPNLRALELDLTGRSIIAVEGFFDDILHSGASTPSDVSSDSGVFSGDEIDFTEVRKSSLRLTGDLRTSNAFPQLSQLQLTGDVANIAVFLKHLTSSLTHLDLVIDDPPDNADWQDLSSLLCERFGNKLLSLRITATGSSRFNELLRSTSRGGDAPSHHLSLDYFTALPSLLRLEVDLPESIAYYNADLARISSACPNIETLRLCPMARFPGSSSPEITLEGVALLTSNCRRLHTLALVLDAKPGSKNILNTHGISSRSLLRLHVGHSYVNDPLQTTVLLSHLAPHLETLKWFHEKNRPGFVEANAQGWQKVSDWLPHLQGIRLTERSEASKPVSPPRQMSDQSVDATITRVFVDRAIQFKPRTSSKAAQIAPSLVDQIVEARPNLLSVSVDAVPAVVEDGIDATPPVLEVSVSAQPTTASTGVDATFIEAESQAIVSTSKSLDGQTGYGQHFYYLQSALPSVVVGLFALACRVFITYPLSIPKHMLDKSFYMPHAEKQNVNEPESEKHISPPDSFSSADLLDRVAPGSYYENISYAQPNDISSPKATFDSENTTLGEHESEPDVSVSAPQALSQAETNNSHTTRHFTETKPYFRSYYDSLMAEPKKQEKDFTEEVDKLLPETVTLSQSGKLQESLDKLFVLEKQTRNAADLLSTTRLAKAIVEQCYEAKDYSQLNTNITVLSKKHGQLKGVVQAVVEFGMGCLVEIKEREGVEKWLELIDTLRSVTEGKIFLETPRARVTLLLSHHNEQLSNSTTTTEPGNKPLHTASDLLNELQVETYSSMERREKTEFILEQMRLLIAVARIKDAEAKKGKTDALGDGEPEWVKVRVSGRKINEDFLKQKDNEDLKLKYYDLMIEYALHHKSYLDAAKHYYKIWETPSIKDDVKGKGQSTLEHIVYNVVLSPHNNEQSDILHHLYVDPALSKLELQYNLVKCFVTRELMRWPGIETLYGPFLRTTPVFASDQRWEDLHMRVVEHNIRVIAEYYTRITFTRLTSLLDLTAPQTEETLARLVVSGTVWARVDRPAGTISFRSKRSAEDVMNDWSSDMQKLLGLVEKTWMGMNAAEAAQSRVKA